MKIKPADLTGQKFGMLTVLERSQQKINGKNSWICLCDCGNKTTVPVDKLRNGNTKSCGCLRLKRLIERNTSHNMSSSRLYKIWAGIHKRCKNKNASNYKIYGARGITVCDEWSDFVPFMTWALENGYKEDLSIDRIDNNGDYSPDNCRWADRKTQCRNKGNNKLLTFNGITKPLVSWAEDLGLSLQTLASRLCTHTVEEALTMPYQPKFGRKYEN